MKQTTGGDYPNPAIAWFTVIVLMLAYTLSFVDRQILSLLVDPIKADLKISDTQLSLVQGFAFAIFYTAFGIPLGALADRANRRNIVIGGVTFWSIATALVGLASSFLQLFGARILVGVGEAALSPSAYSIISDTFDRARRGLAMSIYTTGAYIGSGLALLIGGKVIHYAESAIPFLTSVGLIWKPWQIAVISVSLLGILVVLLLLLIPEPTRKEVAGHSRPTFGQACECLRRRWRFYLPTILALSLISTVFFGQMAWLPAFFMREHGLSAHTAGTKMGLIIIIMAPLGMWTAGFISDWLTAAGHSIGALPPLLVGTLAAIVPAVAVTQIESTSLALVMMAVMIFFLSFPSALGPVVIQSVTPNEYRGIVIAIYLFSVTLVGLGCGPTIVAGSSEYLLSGRSTLGQALSIVSLIAGPCAALLLVYSLRAGQRMTTGQVGAASAACTVGFR